MRYEAKSTLDASWFGIIEDIFTFQRPNYSNSSVYSNSVHMTLVKFKIQLIAYSMILTYQRG